MTGRTRKNLRHRGVTRKQRQRQQGAGLKNILKTIKNKATRCFKRPNGTTTCRVNSAAPASPSANRSPSATRSPSGARNRCTSDEEFEKLMAQTQGLVGRMQQENEQQSAELRKEFGEINRHMTKLNKLLNEPLLGGVNVNAEIKALKNQIKRGEI